MTPRAPRLVLLCPLALLAAGCGGDGPTLAVTLRTDFVPGVEFTFAEVTVEGASGFSRVARTPVVLTDDLEAGVRVAEVQLPAPGDADVDVRLVRADATELAERPYRVTVDAPFSLTALITRSCAGVSCPGAGDDADAVACLGGACVPASCSPETPQTCGDGDCEADGDCPAPTSACATARCASGACVSALDPSACASGEYCDPDLGCQPLSRPPPRPPVGIVKVTETAPILRTPTPGSGECGEYLIAQRGQGRNLRTFMFQGQVYFSIVCKYDDTGGAPADPQSGGWHGTLARWDLTSPAAEWLDGEPGLPGAQQVLNRHRPMAAPIGSFQDHVYVERDDGRLFGLGHNQDIDAFPLLTWRIEAAGVSALDETSWSLFDAEWALETQDGSFRDTEDRHRDILFADGVFWVYSQTNDGALVYASVSQLDYDFTTVTHPSAPLATGLRLPFAAVDEMGGYHLVGFDVGVSRWVRYRGTAPDTFDFSAPEFLELGPLRGVETAWDDALYGWELDQPELAGVEVVGETMYLFYLAGSFDFPSGAPFQGQRGVGVLTVPL